MNMVDFENFSKWLNFYKRLPLFLRSIILILVIGLLSIWLYLQFGPLRNLKRENKNLKLKLENTQVRLNDITDKKNELHRELLHYKELMNPFQRKAEQLYPELEVSAALSKLAEDLNTVKKIATAGFYKSLSKEYQIKLIGKLKEIYKKYKSLSPLIKINVQQGNNLRNRIANDLEKYLKESGFQTKIISGMFVFTSSTPDIALRCNSKDIEFVKELASAIGPFFINKQFAASKDNGLGRGNIEIIINGEPLFGSSGTVSFR